MNLMPLLLAFPLVACSGHVIDFPAADADAGLDAGDQTDLAARLATSLRDYQDRCRLEGDWTVDSFTPSESVAQLTAKYTVLLASRAEWGAACVAALEATPSCRFVLQRLGPQPGQLLVTPGAYFDLYAPDECADAPRGTAAVGDSCLDDVECADGLCDREPGTCGTCVPLTARTGSDCVPGARTRCKDGAYCADDRTCTRTTEVDAGEACDDGRVCPDGETCHGTCGTPLELDAECKHSEECAADLVCDLDEGRCVEPPRTASHRGGPSQHCSDEQPCASTLACTNGRCAEVLEAPSAPLECP